MLLVGDVGGTKTSLVIYAGLSPDDPIIAEATFKTAEFHSLEELLTQFLEINQAKARYAAFGVPGPVLQGSVKTTNLPWIVGEQALSKALKAERTWLLNDLEAIANAVPALAAQDLHTLQSGEPDPTGNMAVIAPGTGLGEAFLTYRGGRYFSHATEGGHVDFAPTSKLQMELMGYLLEQFDHISYERLCSGIGLPNIYRFFRDERRISEPPWLAEELTTVEDPTPVIVEAALRKEPRCEICQETIDLFTEILGAECGNVALKYLATAGVYIAGGMLPKMLPGIDPNRFLGSVANKGRFADFMRKIPIHLVIRSDVGPIGLRRFVQQEMGAL